MPLRHRDVEDVPSALRATIAARLHRADAALRNARPAGDAVHDARKQLKQARAILRLLRDAAENGDDLRAANVALRDAGRPLSATRDATVILATLDALPAPGAASPAIERIRMTTAGQRPGAIDARSLATARRRLAAARQQIDASSLAAGGWRTIERPVRRAYRAARQALRDARQRDDDEAAWHEARKRAKDLRYAIEWLTPLAPRKLGRLAKRARRLTDRLGDAHDLAVLLAAVPSRGGASGEALRSTIDARRASLRQQAVRIGDRLFDAKPKAFVRRLRRKWHALAR